MRTLLPLSPALAILLTCYSPAMAQPSGVTKTGESTAVQAKGPSAVPPNVGKDPAEALTGKLYEIDLRHVEAEEEGKEISRWTPILIAREKELAFVSSGVEVPVVGADGKPLRGKAQRFGPSCTVLVLPVKGTDKFYIEIVLEDHQLQATSVTGNA